VSKEHFKFKIGDIVKEGELIATYDNSPMIGIIYNIVEDHFEFNSEWFGESCKPIQDLLSIYWFNEPLVENLPEELVDFVSRKDS